MFFCALVSALGLFNPIQGFAQGTGELEGQALYDALKAFKLQNKATVSNLILKRNVGEITFTGDIYFSAPVNGRVTGAVFVGKGAFQAEVIKSDFKTAVLRFTDDTYDIIGKGSRPANGLPRQVTALARELEPRLLKETGANISARLTISLANHESPGFFLAQFDKGELDRFTFLIDPQCRILSYIFKIDAAEKVATFRWHSRTYHNEIWVAPYNAQDFVNGRISYSSDFDVVDPKHYKMEIDIRKANRELRTKMRIDFSSLVDNLRAIPMIINENLRTSNKERLKHSMKVESVQYNSQDIACIQEDWESGLTFLLPRPMKKGEEFSIELSMAGDFDDIQGISSWYPRHGFHKSSTFNLIFHHKKRDVISSIGSLVREEKWPDDGSNRLTEYEIDTPVRKISFVSGMLERHSEKRKFEFGEMEINLYSYRNLRYPKSIDEKFFLTELGNALEYFSSSFGRYPYTDFRAAFRPRDYIQDFATLVMLDSGMDDAERYSFLHIGIETSRQWWGNLVSMRSYRDQWLREGLIEYSGLLYVLARMQNIKQQKELLHFMRFNLRESSDRDTDFGESEVTEIGPMILGRKLGTYRSMNYSNVINPKGALVLRMLHYLFGNPSTGEDVLFFDMLKDFTEQYAFKAASTMDFQQITNKHFPKTSIAKKFGLKDLNWFFEQWLYVEKLPSYRMEYRVESSEEGKSVVTGKVIQENAPKYWFMPLPVLLKFPGDQQIQTIVWANGPETEIQIPPLPMKPDSVELDPDMWILSEKTETKRE